jgi:hypothetical protein
MSEKGKAETANSRDLPMGWAQTALRDAASLTACRVAINRPSRVSRVRFSEFGPWSRAMGA